jgi:hypothetical protein
MLFWSADSIVPRILSPCAAAVVGITTAVVTTRIDPNNAATIDPNSAASIDLNSAVMFYSTYTGCAAEQTKCGCTALVTDCCFLATNAQSFQVKRFVPEATAFNADRSGDKSGPERCQRQHQV